jgi:hypothetical protein
MMVLLSRNDITSFARIKELEKQVIPKTKAQKPKRPKKQKPATIVSASAVRLTEKFIDFVKTLPIDDNKKQPRPQRKKWTEQIQDFINSSDYGCTQIQVVFDWYVLHYQELWKLESPSTFIEYFPSLLKRYNRSVNPYTSQQLEPIMKWLLRLRWNCCDDELEIIVGRSLWMVNRLRYWINSYVDKEEIIPKHYILFLDGRIGNTSDFIQFYFEDWFWKHSNTESIRFAEITKTKMLSMIYQWFSEYGAVPKDIVSQLERLKEINFDSEIF